MTLKRQKGNIIQAQMYQTPRAQALTNPDKNTVYSQQRLQFELRLGTWGCYPSHVLASLCKGLLTEGGGSEARDLQPR